MSLFTMQLARKGKPIEIQTRSLDDGFDGDEQMAFTTVVDGAVNAIICTPRGKRVFDGVDADEDVTHEFHLIWPGFDVTVENWILFTAKNKRYRVLRAKNCCEADERMLIECTERGVATQGAANA